MARSDDFNREARMRKAGTRIINYADIDVELADNPEAADTLRARMDAAMDPIDNDPTSFEAIISFGTDPIKALGAIAQKMLTVQGHFSEQVKVMDAAMDEVTNSDAEETLSSLLEALQAAGASTLNAASSGFGALTDKLFSLVSFGKKNDRTKAETKVYELIDQLPAMYLNMKALTKELKESESGIEAVMKEAEELGIERVKMVREMNIYLGAAPEVLRRYDEVYIKEARDEYESSQDPEAELYLQNVVKAKENFTDQYRILESSRAQGVDAAQSLRLLIGEMEKQRKIIQQFSTVRENEWLALMAGAGLQASALKVAGLIARADATGDKFHDLTNEMMEEAHKLTLNSEGRGTVDSTKMLESLRRRQKMIEEENTVREKRALEAEKTRRELRRETEKLIDAVEEHVYLKTLAGDTDVEETTAPTEVAAETRQKAAQTRRRKKPTGPKV